MKKQQRTLLATLVLVMAVACALFGCQTSSANIGDIGSTGEETSSLGLGDLNAPFTPPVTPADLSALIDGMQASDGSVYGHAATVYTPYTPHTPAGLMLFDESEFYDVFISYVRYTPPSQGEIIAPRINFAFGGERSPFDIQVVDAKTDFQAQVYGFGDDGLGRYTFMLSADRSYLNADGTARIFYADAGYPMVNFLITMGRDLNQDRATIRFSAAQPGNILFDVETKLNAAMEAELGLAGRHFLGAGGADQVDLYGAFNDTLTEQPALYCYTVDAKAATVAVYSTDDFTELILDGSQATFTPRPLGHGITCWSASAAENFTVRGSGEDGAKTFNSLFVQASPDLAVTGASVDETALLVGRHTDVYPKGSAAVAFYELYDAQGVLLDILESGAFDVSFAQAGAQRLYLYGVSHMGKYSEPFIIDFTIGDGGKAGIIAVEVADEDKLYAADAVEITIMASLGTESIHIEDLTNHETGFLKPNQYEFGSLGEPGVLLLESDDFEEQDGVRVFAVTLTLAPGNYYLVAVAEAPGASGAGETPGASDADEAGGADEADGGYLIWEVYVNE